MKVKAFNPDGNTLALIEVQEGDVLYYKRGGFPGLNVRVVGFTDKRIQIESETLDIRLSPIKPDGCTILSVHRGDVRLSGEPLRKATS